MSSSLYRRIHFPEDIILAIPKDKALEYWVNLLKDFSNHNQDEMAVTVPSLYCNCKTSRPNISCTVRPESLIKSLAEKVVSSVSMVYFINHHILY